MYCQNSDGKCAICIRGDAHMVNILQEADKLTSGDRQKEYGHPKENFEHLAQLWSVVLGTKVTAHQVILCLIQLKVSRAMQGYKRDTYVDIAGYARTAEMIEPHEVEDIRDAFAKKAERDMEVAMNKEVYASKPALT